MIAMSAILQELADLLRPSPVLSLLLMAAAAWIWRLKQQRAQANLREARLVAQLMRSTCVIVESDAVISEAHQIIQMLLSGRYHLMSKSTSAGEQ